jgi:type I restriction enzyme M protein
LVLGRKEYGARGGKPLEGPKAPLVAELNGQFAESAELEQAIKANLAGLGYGG